MSSRACFSPRLPLFILCLAIFCGVFFWAAEMPGRAAAASFEVWAPKADIPLTPEQVAKAGWNFAKYRRSVYDMCKGPHIQFVEESGILEKQSIEHEGVTMHFRMFKIGEPGPDGYPLFIALHGGGGGSKAINDQQWGHMQSYYRDSVADGVYVAVRGVRDTWDTHFNPESYALYDQLIEIMTATQKVDPNRVYLLGFSAGGDGVYGIAPRMPDRFAAVAMSAGHPNGVNPTNLHNLPILLQCGQYDGAYKRNLETALFSRRLDELHGQRGGYPHEVYIHMGAGHNFHDNDPSRAPQPIAANPLECIQNKAGCLEDEANTNSIDFLVARVRNPLPQTLYWDLSTRAPMRMHSSFYWLSAPETTNQGTIKASYNSENQQITIDAENVNGPFSVLLNDDMLDITQPVTVVLNGRDTGPHTLNLDENLAINTAIDRLDPNFVFLGIINIVVK